MHLVILYRLSQILMFIVHAVVWMLNFFPICARQIVINSLSFRRSSIGTFIRSHPSSDSSASSHSSKPKKEAPPKLDYRSMVSIDDMPALFVSFDSKFWRLRIEEICSFPRSHLFLLRVFDEESFFFVRMFLKLFSLSATTLKFPLSPQGKTQLIQQNSGKTRNFVQRKFLQLFFHLISLDVRKENFF